MLHISNIFEHILKSSKICGPFWGSNFDSPFLPGLHSEMLLTCRSDTTLAESLWLVAAGFGSGLQVWERANFATGDGE